ncbi:leucine/isoleucine/valine transporter permease subunit [Peptococcaceae bacterium CEB3]|nr:leucine/isoleucine/valine transporter permease subunit [Peptococcaceae bacterium CEB3]
MLSHLRIPERFLGTKGRVVSLAVIVILIILLPLVANSYVKEVMTNAFFYMILALGLNIVIGYAGLVDLGYAAFFAVGAYTTGVLTKAGLNFWLTIPITVIFSLIAGVVIGGPTLRLRSDYLAIVTLGFGEITRITARNLKITGGASGLVGIRKPSLFGYPLTHGSDFYYLFFILVVLAAIVAFRLHNSRLGRAWQYIREDEDAAAAMGIDPVRTKLYAYMLGAVFGGVAGSFFAVKMTAVSPETFAFTQSAMILMAVILGGMGKLAGAILGALVLVLFPEVFRTIGQSRQLVFGIVLIIIMIFRPQGLWPQRRD